MKRKYFSHFNIAGFTYYEGAIVFEELQIGTILELKSEPDNKFDDNAVAIYYKDHKLGFIPRSINQPIRTILDTGFDIFEARVQVKRPETYPEKQISVIIYAKYNE
ncbi:MAG: HIRAN domain-containing protein [Bacteroidales bacterium]|nr:HIRAN domain-containing protein [Bacteroidales bacterium]